jgi:hypothetical protein
MNVIICDQDIEFPRFCSSVPFMCCIYYAVNQITEHILAYSWSKVSSAYVVLVPRSITEDNVNKTCNDKG